MYKQCHYVIPWQCKSHKVCTNSASTWTKSHSIYLYIKQKSVSDWYCQPKFSISDKGELQWNPSKPDTPQIGYTLNRTPSKLDSLYSRIPFILNMACCSTPTYSYMNNPLNWRFCSGPEGSGIEHIIAYVKSFKL